MLRARQAYGGTLGFGSMKHKPPCLISCLSLGWDEMDQSPLLVLISHAVWDRESSCPWSRQEHDFKCFNKYLFEFLKLVS